MHDLGPIVGRFRGQRVAVVMGGLSHERAVSLNTGAAIAGALRDRGYDVVAIDAGRDVVDQLRASGAAVVYNALHGSYGEDGRFQGLLDWLGVPYTGEGLEASHLAFQKAHAKALMRAAGVPVAADVVWTAAAFASASPADLPFPLPAVVKPVAEGSSVGVSIVRDADDWARAQGVIAGKGDVLIEAFVAGPELSVAILGDAVLGAVEVEASRTFYDYDAKYAAGSGTQYHLPPRLPAAQIAAAEAAALASHRLLGCHGATRTDVILGPAGPVVLEVNTLPGMTATSLVPKIAAARGLSFGELLERILDKARCGLPQEVPHGA
ncbi:MAG: D-alanine--D-alanine ligase [Myxococcales bacterium]|nr:D-alanine--D-alanine ligase [Myxococcales bacterium]MCB9544972.1 D-alanine--D-alanine ligase [Myxococcales bacterium]